MHNLRCVDPEQPFSRKSRTRMMQPDRRSSERLYFSNTILRVDENPGMARR